MFVIVYEFGIQCETMLIVVADDDVPHDVRVNKKKYYYYLFCLDSRWKWKFGLFWSRNCCVSLIAGNVFNCDGFMAILVSMHDVIMAAAATVCFQCMHNNQKGINFISIIVTTHKNSQTERCISDMLINLFVFNENEPKKSMQAEFLGKFVCMGSSAQ